MTHWYTSPDPPKFGEDLVAICGATVPSAQPVPALWDAEELDGLVKCHECDVHLAWKRYSAVIQSGQEAKMKGAE